MVNALRLSLATVPVVACVALGALFASSKGAPISFGSSLRLVSRGSNCGLYINHELSIDGSDVVLCVLDPGGDYHQSGSQWIVKPGYVPMDPLYTPIQRPQPPSRTGDPVKCGQTIRLEAASDRDRTHLVTATKYSPLTKHLALHIEAGDTLAANFVVECSDDSTAFWHEGAEVFLRSATKDTPVYVTTDSKARYKNVRIIEGQYDPHLAPKDNTRSWIGGGTKHIGFVGEMVVRVWSEDDAYTKTHDEL